MITYVNEKNAIKYQVLFDKAAQALNENSASGGTTTIASLPEYFANIGDLAKLKSKAVFLRIPLDEEPFEIDLNARTINIPESFAKNGIAVKGDQVAEIVYFKVDRFFDAQDLSNTDIYIEWSTGKARGISKAFCVDDSSVAGYIIFGWAITSAMTKDGNATLTFAPRFVLEADDSSEDSIKFKYSLSTVPHSVKISDTLDLSNIEDVEIDTTDADLIFSRIVNSDIEGDNIVHVEPGADFTWVLQPATSPETAQIWFANPENGGSGKTVYAQAKTREGYLSYRWEVQTGEDEWRGINNNNSNIEEDTGTVGDMQLAFDYTLFRKYIPAAGGDSVEKAYYVMYDSKPANQVSYPGYATSDLETQKYFVRIDGTPSADSETDYYIVETGNSNDGYGQILSGILYWYKEDNVYKSLADAVNAFRPKDSNGNYTNDPGSFIGPDVEAALMPYGKIYTMRTSYTITDPGTYRVKAVVSQDSEGKKTVATIYSSPLLNAAEPELIPTEEIGNLEKFNIAVSSEVSPTSVYYNEDASTAEGITNLEAIDNENIASSQILTVDNPESLTSKYCHGVGEIEYQWCKNGEEIAGANESNYTATEPGVYTVKVGNAINNRTTWNNDENNIANITSLPSVPTVALTGTSTTVDNEGSYHVGETLTVAISSDLETEGLYFAWKQMVINPSIEGSIDLNTEENDIAKWSGGNSILPDKSSVDTWTSTFTPTETGYYYCLVYNSLNGILSSPLKVGYFNIVE